MNKNIPYFRVILLILALFKHNFGKITYINMVKNLIIIFSLISFSLALIVGFSFSSNIIENTKLISVKGGKKEISLTFTGDVILARSVNFLTVKNNDFTWSFKNIAEELRNSDLTIINLESPLIKNCPLTNEGFKFCGDERNVEGLVYSGIDVVGLANNHAGNYGKDGVEETIKNLEKNNISVSGANKRKIAYKEVEGVKIAFLSLNTIGYIEDSLVWGSEENIKSLISEAKKNSDIVIVQMHWGVEYVEEPTETQKKLGRLAIDSGADMVVGNHPHWIQKYEIYKDKYILYALGNFIFDQEWSKETKEGVIAKVRIRDMKISDLEFVPIEIRNYGQVFKSDNNKILPKLMKGHSE